MGGLYGGRGRLNSDWPPLSAPLPLCIGLRRLKGDVKRGHTPNCCCSGCLVAFRFFLSLRGALQKAIELPVLIIQTMVSQVDCSCGVTTAGFLRAGLATPYSIPHLTHSPALSFSPLISLFPWQVCNRTLSPSTSCSASARIRTSGLGLWRSTKECWPRDTSLIQASSHTVHSGQALGQSRGCWRVTLRQQSHELECIPLLLGKGSGPYHCLDWEEED